MAKSSWWRNIIACFGCTRARAQLVNLTPLRRGKTSGPDQCIPTWKFVNPKLRSEKFRGKKKEDEEEKKKNVNITKNFQINLFMIN